MKCNNKKNYKTPEIISPTFLISLILKRNMVPNFNFAKNTPFLITVFLILKTKKQKQKERLQAGKS